MSNCSCPKQDGYANCCKVMRLQEENRSLLNAVKASYEKHTLGKDTIGWQELNDILLCALCNSMGDKGYQEWLEAVSPKDGQGVGG